MLNIASTAEISFPYHYSEPYIFLYLLYLDANRMLEGKLIVVGYMIIILVVFLKYSFFLYTMITKLTEFLGIKFLKVKEIGKTK